MIQSQRFLMITSLLASMTLSACGGSTVKDTLGLSRKAPDEYRVVARPPLTVPPQFNLRPPLRPGDPAAARNASEEARSLVTGASADNTFKLPASEGAEPVKLIPQGSAKTSTPEKSFLERAGALEADPTVREKLTEEQISAQEAREEEQDSWWNIFPSGEKKDPLVHAKGESERIKQNQQAGKPVTEGETPEVKQRDRGILRHILGD